MAGNAAGQAAVAEALNKIEPGVGDVGDSLEPPDGMPRPMSMQDLLGEISLGNEGGEGDGQGTEEEGAEKPSSATEKGGKGKEQGKTAPTGKASTETPPQGDDEEEDEDEDGEEPDQEQLAKFGLRMFRELQDDPAQLLSDLFEQMNARNQKAFIDSVTGGTGGKGAPANSTATSRGGKAQTVADLAEYEPQGEMEEWLQPHLPAIEAIPQLQQHIGSVTQAVTQQAEAFNLAAAHNHALQVILEAFLEDQGLSLGDLDLQKVLRSANRHGSFLEGAKRTVGVEFRKALKANRQANKQRPVDSRSGASDVPTFKVGESAVSILKKMQGG